MKKKFLGSFLLALACATNAMPAAEKASEAELDLIDAAWRGDLKSVKKHLQIPGINVDAKNVDDDTALSLAVINGEAECVRVLLVHGADADVLECDQGTLLHMVARKGYIICLEELLKRPLTNVNVQDCYGNTPLHHAAAKGHIECILELMQHGADVTLANNDGQVPLQFAELKGHVACVEILQAAGKKQLEEQG
ncbi:ankyrin repeat domain-containing protein [bacterium]|nr:MAG: ankyrin repeat domain-containing protein [bacterium]